MLSCQRNLRENGGIFPAIKKRGHHAPSPAAGSSPQVSGKTVLLRCGLGISTYFASAFSATSMALLPG
ncbi:hypothetical protein B4135_2531 [Caldibacillus debilis]|uniref:Uncharacterized protein n=1 Tax=Caldibacillus debilis TaxID=301148 RepID=A0A150M021_9BACI|nr:hypothetical protein B4135_2531 [Caldibacillus debilis]